MKTMQKLLLVLLSCLLLAVPALAAETPADGTYTVELTMSGGTGKASIDSPVEIVVEDGAITATVVWSSSNYDRMT
ncbi:MAG: ferrichrome ABC transporter substrate-binding protein, partial [Clostridiales bacterium]|nr:ferrichrome ABC transporter substrate-binding protein [Clostridiales bacterium]